MPASNKPCWASFCQIVLSCLACGSLLRCWSGWWNYIWTQTLNCWGVNSLWVKRQNSFAKATNNVFEGIRFGMWCANAWIIALSCMCTLTPCMCTLTPRCTLYVHCTLYVVHRCNFCSPWLQGQWPGCDDYDRPTCALVQILPSTETFKPLYQWKSVCPCTVHNLYCIMLPACMWQKGGSRGKKNELVGRLPD